MTKNEICAEWDHRAVWNMKDEVPPLWQKKALEGWTLISVVPVGDYRMAYFQREKMPEPVTVNEPTKGNKKPR